MILHYNDDYETEEWTAGMAEFMARMSEKAAWLGMSSSTFANPYGGSAFGYNRTNCMDLLKLGLYAWSYPILMDVMTNREDVKIHVYGEHRREVLIGRDYQKIHKDAYESIHGPGSISPHIVYGGKGGGWNSGEHKVFAFLAYGRVEGHDILTVVANTTADASVGRTYRQWATAEVMDICAAVLRGEPAEGRAVSHAEHAAAILLPAVTPSAVMKNRPLEPLFTQREEECFNPASISKILMAITAVDICGGVHEIYRIEECDMCNDSDYWAFPGDVESMADGLYPILINSNGSNTLALARHCGEILLERKEHFPDAFGEKA